MSAPTVRDLATINHPMLSLLDFAASTKCKRGGVAALVTLTWHGPGSDDLISPVGLARNEVTANGCTNAPGACGCEHAEARALAQLLAAMPTDSSHVIGKRLDVLVTTAPCVDCARKLLGAARLYRAELHVTYMNAYRLPTGIYYLQANAVDVIQWTPTPKKRTPRKASK